VKARSRTTISAGSSPVSTSSRRRPARRRASATFEPELGSFGQPRQLCLLGLPRLLVVDGQQQLDQRPATGFPRLLEAGAERLEVVSSPAPIALVVARISGGGAEVAGQRQRHALGRALREAAVLAPIDVDVGVAEAIDRLKLVADDEELG